MAQKSTKQVEWETRIETKLDDVLEFHQNGCAKVHVNRNWLVGITGVLVISVGVLTTQFYTIHDKVNKIYEMLPSLGPWASQNIGE